MCTEGLLAPVGACEVCTRVPFPAQGGSGKLKMGYFIHKAASLCLGLGLSYQFFHLPG